MSSSNRHWPSLFKSKPCNPHPHQWQHDINASSLLSTGFYRTPYSSGCEERSPEPKPRWNPKPEQIRILEAIFNSGTVNPPREEIRKIRLQLQEYGQVGDANVFYWFQNRKSRSKHKLRHLQNSKQQNSQALSQAITQQIALTNTTAPFLMAPSSSSSSSNKSSPKEQKSASPGSVNKNLFPEQNDLVPEPFFFPIQDTLPGIGTESFTHGFCFNELSDVIQVQDSSVEPCTSLFLGEIMNSMSSRKEYVEEKKIKIMEPLLGFNKVNHGSDFVPQFSSLSATAASTVPSDTSPIQGVGESSPLSAAGAVRSMVFINDVPFEISVGTLNVREAFGDNAVLVHSSGHPVLTDEWGITLNSLQHGSSYYLI